MIRTTQLRSHLSRPAVLLSGLTLALVTACVSANDGEPEPTKKMTPPPAPTIQAMGVDCPIPGATLRNDLILPGEEHFAQLWMLTDGGQNAEGYWSFKGDRLVIQRRQRDMDIDCDRIYLTDPVSGELSQVSSGRGVTTCSYFLPGDKQVLFASTQAHHESCPPPVDMSEGYTWMVHPEYEVYVHDLASGSERAITEGWGYDAEATVSPAGDRMVFTSTRSGDLELWTANLDGSDLVQVTDELGYDGGGFFNHAGDKIVFRTTRFIEDKLETEHRRYQDLLAEWKVRPHSMDIMVIDADGKNRRRITDLGQASFAPFFFPDDSRILFSTNHHDKKAKRNFDLYAIDVDGSNLERITMFEGFDSFPMFSPDGKYVAFASNRGNSKAGDTNQFVALWK